MNENNGALADVAAAAGYGGRGYDGGFGGGYWMFFLFLLFALIPMMAGGNWGGGNYGAAPYIGQQAEVQRGFDQQAVMSGIGNLTTAVSNGFSQAEVAACNRAMATQQALNNGFNSLAMAGVQGFNTVNTGLADNKFTFAQEECATRQTINAGFRDVIENQNRNAQRILDQMCQDKIDEKNDIIAQLRQELLYARGQASQDVQTGAIQAGQRALANEIEQYVRPAPNPAYIVPNPNYYNNCGTNCGCGA